MMALEAQMAASGGQIHIAHQDDKSFREILRLLVSPQILRWELLAVVVVLYALTRLGPYSTTLRSFFSVLFH